MTIAKLPPALFERAAALYRPLGNFAWQFARGKLRADPVFASLLQSGLIPSNARLLDVGCGQGLLAALLFSVQAGGSTPQAWPQGWAPAPTGVRVRGIELAPKSVGWAQAALAHVRPQAEFVHGDMRTTEFGHVDVAVLLDVLHYVNFEVQRDVLSRVKTSLGTDGHLLLRIGDAAAGLPFRFSTWVDAIMSFVRNQRLSRLYCRPLSQWLTLLAELGFKVQTLPMHGGTPFANVLLVARPISSRSAMR